MVPPMESSTLVDRRGTVPTRPVASREFRAGEKWVKQMDATMQTAWREFQWARRSGLVSKGKATETPVGSRAKRDSGSMLQGWQTMATQPVASPELPGS